MLVTAPDRKHLQLAASHKPFCKASRRAECGKSACSVRRGGGWKTAYGSVSEALGAADKAANLERWKSFLCQLPVFGQIAYPVRAEATKHDKPGCKSLGCPAEKFRSGRSDLGGEQTRRPEHKEMSATSRISPRKNRVRGYQREADLKSVLGRPMTPRKKQANALGGTVGVGDQASGGRFSELTSGEC